MECGNKSRVTEFILLGLSDDPSIQTAIFYIFLTIYTFTLAANVMLIVAVRMDNCLHNSMYFFLANLSFLDICYTSIIVPNMLVRSQTLWRRVSFTGCIMQLYLYLFIGENQCVLLAFMAYDRFVAICYPLRYNMMMSKMVCARMITATYMISFIITSLDVITLSHLTFVGPNIINHFFCEAPSVVQLACDYTSLANILNLAGGILLLITPLFLIILSYIQIVTAITKIHSGRYKVFSKCMSHLIVVVLYYGPSIFMYMRPRDAPGAKDKIVSVIYTSVTPMLNPLIYSLRNQNVKKALKKIRKSTVSNFYLNTKENKKQ